jgi:hypothetical protein
MADRGTGWLPVSGYTGFRDGRTIPGRSLDRHPTRRWHLGPTCLRLGCPCCGMMLLDQLARTILLCRDYVIDSVSDDEICQSFQDCRIRCVSDLHNLSSHSGQTALVTLVSLLNRMGMQVSLDIPEVSMISPQPPLSGLFLRESLLASSERLVTGATVSGDAHYNADLTFVLGDSQVSSNPSSVWRLTGTEWSGALARNGTARAWTAEWPIGSMISAAEAAAEAFKFVMRRLPTVRAGRALFEHSVDCEWDFGSVALPIQGINLGEVDTISAGAISQAALYALLRIPNLQMSGRIFDDDLTAPSNLNRNMLSLTTDIHLPKVDVVATQCARRFRLQAVPIRFTGANSTERLAENVIVGVDDIPSRWAIQRCAPGWLGVGGTSHFSVSSSEHDICEACCGCLHNVDDEAQLTEIPTVSFVSFWAGLATAVRLLRYNLGRRYSENRQHLWLTPITMGELHSAMWFPIPVLRDCPVQCFASQSLGPVTEETIRMWDTGNSGSATPGIS